MKRKIPVYIDYDTGTIFLQDKKTGLMEGRKKTSSLGDGTPVRRVKRKFGKYDKGEIIGRRSSIFSTTPKSRQKKELGLARASLSTRKRVSSLGGKAKSRH